jgi:hypothetical protein
LVAETWKPDDLFRAGWSQADIDWEHEIESFADNLAGGNAAAAREAARRTVFIARQSFDPGDPRLGTALANYALCLAQSGDDAAAGLLEEGGRAWARSGPWIEAMTAPRTARSSLFHMRMEQRHRDAYEENWRVKWRQLADEATRRISGATVNALPDVVSVRTACQRWRRERPAMLNDTRKLMAAVLLLLPGV